MYSILILTVIAAASAAPYYGHHSPGVHRPGFVRPQDIFDAHSHSAQLNQQLRQLSSMMKRLFQNLPVSITQAGIEGNQYKIVIPLTGYKEEEITVKVNAGVLTIQAVRNTGDGNQKSYKEVRSLPNGIDSYGFWTYVNNVLTIQFPLKKSSSPTVYPVRRREEISHDDNDNLDADVGNRGDNGQDKEMETNEIPEKRERVGSTTYAVDLKDDVEFVPVSYYND